MNIFPPLGARRRVSPLGARRNVPASQSGEDEGLQEPQFSPSTATTVVPCEMVRELSDLPSLAVAAAADSPAASSSDDLSPGQSSPVGRMRKSVSFNSFALAEVVARVPSSGDLTVLEKQEGWYRKEDFGGFVQAELDLRRRLGVRSLGALSGVRTRDLKSEENTPRRDTAEPFPA